MSLLPLWKVQFFPDDVPIVVLTLCCALFKFFCFYRCYVGRFTQFQSVSGGSLNQLLVSAALVLFLCHFDRFLAGFQSLR